MTTIRVEVTQEDIDQWRTSDDIHNDAARVVG